MPFKGKERKYMKKAIKTAAEFLLFFVLGCAFFTATVSAYIDPSAMTYIVQVVVGIVIAGAAAFGFYFQRLRRKLKKKDEAAADDYDSAAFSEEEIEDDGEFDDSDIPDDDEDTESK